MLALRSLGCNNNISSHMSKLNDKINVVCGPYICIHPPMLMCCCCCRLCRNFTSTVLTALWKTACNECILQILFKISMNSGIFFILQTLPSFDYCILHATSYILGKSVHNASIVCGFENGLWFSPYDSLDVFHLCPVIWPTLMCPVICSIISTPHVLPLSFVRLFNVSS